MAEAMVREAEDLENVSKEELIEEVQTLRKELEEIKPLEVSDKKAKKIILDYIADIKAKGQMEFDFIDINLETKLPVEQIWEVLGKLKKEGRVSEVEDDFEWED